MIIKIDLSTRDASAFDRNKLSELFEEASRASLLGYHRVVLSRGLAKWAVENLDLSDRHKVHITKIGHEYAQLGQQYKSAAIKIRIRADVLGIIEEGDGTWTVGVQCAGPEGVLSQTSLVFENGINDGDFYKLILEMSAKSIGFGDISYVAINGGGNGCGGQIQRISNEGKVVSCICDTDIKVPGGAKSQTYQSTIRARDNSKPLGIVLGTPCMEIENFLPISIVRSLTNEIEALNHIEELVRRQGANVEPGDCLWLFVDIKSGFRVGQLDDYCRNENLRQWVCRKYNVVDEEIRDIFVPPFGADLLRRFMASNELIAEMHKHVRSTYWKTHFLDWVRMVLWALAGRKRERVS